ncbi:MAG TPA: isoprenylcysteine carboxylmethyltransferase family protein [Terriglobia bacterium]|nr:isoprenylcysteine carboxylmethyltransferase family protein [Terriglobia bacterium]
MDSERLMASEDSAVSRSPLTLASLAAGAAFFALWLWLLPRWLGFHVDVGGMAMLRWLAAIPAVFGFAVALRCVWDFAFTGRGSPAPFAPPMRLVVVGFYRHVRNPIYVGAAAGWIGLWLVLGHASLAGIVTAGAAALAVHLFVTLYEEPTLRRKFGPDYEEYCRNVRRWLPRAKAWSFSK